MSTETVERVDVLLKNKAGGPSYVASDDELVVRYLTTGMVGSTYYSSKPTIAFETVQLCQRVMWHDPEFLAKAIVYARREGLMRTAPLIALAILSTAQDKKPFYAIFNTVVRTPGDLQDFIALTRGGLEMDSGNDPMTAHVAKLRKIQLRGTGRAVRRAVNNWLAQASSHHIIKYGADGQKMPLKDVIRLTHGRFEGTAQAQAAWLRRGEQEAGLPSQIAIYDDFKRLAPQPEHFEDALEAITKGKLPWEKVTGPFGKLSKEKTTRLWATMLYQMPYMALLRNLNNLLKNGVLEDSAHLAYVINTLSSVERVKSSKQFPFAFYVAYMNIQGTSEAAQSVRGALQVALDISVANVPYLGRRVLCACDTSGSMDRPLSDGGSESRSYTGNRTPEVSYGDAAHLFGVSIFKQNESRVDLVDFNSILQDRTRELRHEMSVMSMVKHLSNFGGGTALWLPFKYAIQKLDVTYDTIVAFTDNESWAGEMVSGHYGTQTAKMIAEYRALRNPNINILLVTLAANASMMTPPEAPGVHYLAGWSSSVLDYMGYVVKDNGSALDRVRGIVLY